MDHGGVESSEEENTRETVLAPFILMPPGRKKGGERGRDESNESNMFDSLIMTFHQEVSSSVGRIFVDFAGRFYAGFRSMCGKRTEATRTFGASDIPGA